ncbi:MAG TPA: aldo/keto reductase [Synechococcales cyanobacterium M55_K2018_004]|nr:aldo/keto reductase [Synechococcales cyanobacterium M55_K2018_004]
MRYHFLGRTGLLVSELCLGTMTFGGKGFWQAIGKQQQEEANHLVSKAVDAGVNFIDTADAYSEGESEKILGNALRSVGVKREEIVIATKVRLRMGPGKNQVGLSRVHIMNAVRESLERLQTDYIDLYQIHGADPYTPIDETLRVLEDLVRSGLVRYIGCCNLMAWQIMKALGISERQGWSRFESVQAYYTIAGRDLEREIVPLLQDQSLGLLVWSPLAGGLLSGKFSRDNPGPRDARRASFDFPPVNRDRAYAVIDVMRAIALEKGTSVAQIALAWLLHQEVVTSVIIGAKDSAQLEDNLGSTAVRLTEDELTRLDAVSALPREYPGWMLERQGGDRLPAPEHT